MKNKYTFAGALLVIGGAASMAHAAVTIDYTKNGTVENTGGFTVSSTDLLASVPFGNITDALNVNTGELGWTTSNGPFLGGDNATVESLRDGIFNSTTSNTFGSNLVQGSTGSLPLAGGTITYTFDTGVNTFGYSISEVGIYTGWVNGNRSNINVTVSYATVSDPSTFVTLGNASTTTSDEISDSQPGERFARALMTEDSLPFLATNVKSIRFDFGSGIQENGGGGYKELDVLGVASIPEPSAAFLGGLGVLALLRRRRA
jgi:hypothetical protein